MTSSHDQHRPVTDTPGSDAATLTRGTYVRGALYALAAVSIWAGWIVVARLGLTTSLSPGDIAALRFGVAGLLLLPVLLHKGIALDQIGWSGLAALALGGGAPRVLLAKAGLLFAPAAHAGALFPGVMPVMVALLAAIILRERFSRMRTIGLLLIVTGALVIIGGVGVTLGTRQNIGHLLFLSSALLWAVYTVTMRRARLDGLHAAAIAAVSSMVVYVPLFLVFGHGKLLAAPRRDAALQGFVQGVLTAVVSLVCYGRAVGILGASRAASFAALAPAMTALMAIPVMGEVPTPHDWIGTALISLGVYAVSEGPLPVWLKL